MGISSTCDACGAPVPLITAILASPQNQPAGRVPDSAQAPQRQGHPLLLKISEAAREMGISRQQVHVLLEAGEIHRVRLGPQTVRIPFAEIEALIARKLS
jgi:excisionase family DNA binding protein